MSIIFIFFCSLLTAHCSLSCVSGGAASAEEYYSIGMAYFDIGKFDEAEKWLSRARAKDKTKVASDYNLGRIAFETGRYNDAVKYFESILKRDPDNVMALKAAAYTHIRNGDIEKAEELYARLLGLVPESADEGYNYALVLFAMEKYEQAEQALESNEFALLDNDDVLLLYARTQKELGKPEAIDNYAAWLANNTNDAKVRSEFAQLLEDYDLYARALDEYRLAIGNLNSSSVDPSRPEIRFAIARLLFIADGENKQAVSELQGAVNEGYNNFEAMEKLLDDERISDANRDSIQTIITEAKRAEEAAKAAEAKAAEAAAETAEDIAENINERLDEILIQDGVEEESVEWLFQ